MSGPAAEEANRLPKMQPVFATTPYPSPLAIRLRTLGISVDGEPPCRCGQLTDGRSIIKTIRGFKRLLTELPQPARTFYWCFYAMFLATFALGVATRMNWVAIGVSGAGIFLFLFGLYVFRDINDTATTWSRIYKESRGIKPENFTFADVPTIKAMRFLHMIGGLSFVAGGIGFASS